MANEDYSNLISVVFVTYNSEKVIGRALEATIRHLPAAEVIVVDNSSDDDTRGAVEHSGVDLTLLHGHGNVGFGAGANIGIRAARRPFILLLNPDALIVRVEPGVLCEIVAENRSVGLLGCQIAGNRWWSRDYHLIFPEAHWSRRLVRYFFMNFLTPREFSWPRQRAWFNRRNIWVTGAAILALRADLLRVGGFDERYFLYGEDRDLSRRCAAAAIPVRATTSITVDHAGGESSAGVDATKHLTWTLLSIMQFENCETDRVRIARISLRMLQLYAAIANPFGATPVIGSRVRRRAGDALSVRRALVQFSQGDGPQATYYPEAAQAIRRALSVSTIGD